MSHALCTQLSITENEVAITLHFQLCFTACYTVLQMNNSMRSASAGNPVTTENIRTIAIIDVHRESSMCYHKLTPCTVKNGMQWRTKVSP